MSNIIGKEYLNEIEMSMAKKQRKRKRKLYECDLKIHKQSCNFYRENIGSEY